MPGWPRYVEGVSATLVAAVLWIPEVSLEKEPPPQSPGVFSLVALLCVLLIAVVLLRRLLRGRKGSNLLFSMSVGVGNALMDLAHMLNPNGPNVESVDKAESPGENDAEGEDVGDGRKPPP